MGTRQVTSHDSAAAASTMAIDRPNAMASGSPSTISISSGIAMNMASTTHNTASTLRMGAHRRSASVTLRTSGMKEALLCIHLTDDEKHESTR